MHAYASREDATRYLTWGPNDWEESEAQLAAFVEAAEAVPRLIYELALTFRPEGRLIGALCLYLDHHEGSPLQSAELGFVLHPDFWGQGLVTEAATALLSCGISDLGLTRIWATCDARNGASVRVLQKNRHDSGGTGLRSKRTHRMEWRMSCDLVSQRQAAARPFPARV